jgi:enterochelin esterase-like enzyme
MFLIRTLAIMGLIFLNRPRDNPRWTNTEEASFYSPSRDMMIDFVIFTPPGYEKSTERYPVLYFLHGRSGNQYMYWGQINAYVPDANGDAGAWISELITDGTIPPMIIVTPDDADGMWNEINEPMITQELINHIDANWRTIPNKSGRAIEGFSMGGMGASQYPARHPSLYCSTIIMSAPLGDELILDWENNTQGILDNQLRTKLEVGSEDHLLNSMTTLHEGLDALDIPHQYEIVPGIRHIWGELYNQVGIDGLQFHGECFEQTLPLPPHRLFLPTIMSYLLPH